MRHASRIIFILKCLVGIDHRVILFRVCGYLFEKANYGGGVNKN